MRVASTFVANSATVNDAGLLDVAGGGWDSFYAPVLPWTVSGTLVAVCEYDKNDGVRPPALRVEAYGPGGARLDYAASAMIRQPSEGNGELVRFSLAIPFTFIASELGITSLRLFDEDGIVSEVSFNVAHRANR